jgi:hypothetical protein
MLSTLDKILNMTRDMRIKDNTVTELYFKIRRGYVNPPLTDTKSILLTQRLALTELYNMVEDTYLKWKLEE